MDQLESELKEICKDHSIENFYKKNGLGNFYKKHKPNSLSNYLAPYMRHRRLKNYHLLEYHNKTKIVPTKTYIKYINIDDAKDGNFRSSHIKAGGILIGCGKFVNDKFVELDDPLQWKILKLKFDPSAIIDKKNGKIVRDRIDPRIFHININKNYVFYKNFDNGMYDIMKNRMDRIEVVLCDSKGKIVK